MEHLGQEAFSHARILSVDLPPRTVGSASHHAAADYIAMHFAAAGLGVERQEIPVPDWEELSTTLELNGQPLEAFANTFSPSAEVAAPTIALGTLAELRGESNGSGSLEEFFLRVTAEAAP